MKESNKAESNNKAKNGGTGALFPRLHVKETRNNGPRAPPRNKMALYEQFTIPSHRFQQPTPQQQQQQQQHQQQNGVPSPFMPQAFAGGYYLPYYMAPQIAYQPMMLQSQPGYDGECDQGDMQQVPGGHNNSLPRVSSKCTSSVKAKPSKGGKDDRQEDFRVPTYTLKPIGLPQKQQEHLQTNTSAGNSTVCTAGETANKSGSSKRSRDELPKVQIEAASLADAVNQNFSPRNSCESNEGSGGIDNQSDNERRQSPPSEEPLETSDDSEASILENSVAELSCEDILSAVGDERFWKMRKAMQRQQNIFQKQLFELHRLTKVQQLMAAAGLGDREENQNRKQQQQPPPPPPPQQQQQHEQQEHHQQQQQRHKTGTEQVPKKPKDNNKRASSGEARVGSKQADSETRAGGSPPPLERVSTPATTPAPENPYDYRCYPPQGYPGYPSFPPVNHHPHHHHQQWYAPVPVQFPYQQPFPAPAPAVNIYTAPYGSVYPFVPFTCDQRPVQDPRYNVVPPQGHQWQPPLNYFNDPGMQWMEYVNSSGQAFKENTQSQLQSKDFHSQAGSSSAGFNLIQRSSASKEKEPSEAQQQQQQQQQQQRSQLQQKLVGKFSEAKQASSSAGKSSPYSRPSGFHAVNNSSMSRSQSGSKIIKVAPKAAMVTPESAAEILQSIRQERPQR